MALKKTSPKKIVLYAVVFLVGCAAGFCIGHLFQKKNPQQFQTPQQQASAAAAPNQSPDVSYRPVVPFNADISVIAQGINQVSDIEITPDGQYMLVATLPGDVIAFKKVNGAFVKQDQVFYHITTSQVTMPTVQTGLTGIAFGADFATSKDVFLFYSTSAPSKEQALIHSNNLNQSIFTNGIIRVTFATQGNDIVGTAPDQIFTSNMLGSQAHSIEKGIGIMVDGKPHVLFTTGDSFGAQYAADPTNDAGKLLLIQRDGTAPLGTRPYQQNKIVQGIEMRNGTTLARDPNNGMIAMIDLALDNYDQFLYGSFLDTNGNNDKPVVFNWDGNDISMLKPVIDPYNGDRDTVLHRWSPTETPVNISFYSNSTLPALPSYEEYVLLDTFGVPLSTENKPGKRIMLGVLNEQNYTLALQGLVERSAAADGSVGNPIGMAVNPQTKDIYFGDIMEGRIYKVTLK